MAMRIIMFQYLIMISQAFQILIMEVVLIIHP